MPNFQYAHVCLRCRNLEEMTQFYESLLQAERVFDFYNKQKKKFGLYLEFAPKQYIELFQDETASPSTGGLNHFCLECNDLDELIEHAQSVGIETGKKKMGADQAYQVWVTDPEGNRFEFHQYTPQSHQFTKTDTYVEWA